MGKISWGVPLCPYCLRSKQSFWFPTPRRSADMYIYQYILLGSSGALRTLHASGLSYIKGGRGVGVGMECLRVRLVYIYIYMADYIFRGMKPGFWFHTPWNRHETAHETGPLKHPMKPPMKPVAYLNMPMKPVAYTVAPSSEYGSSIIKEKQRKLKKSKEN